MYILLSSGRVFGTRKDDMDKRDLLDKLYQHFPGEIQKQRERDFPRGSVRNGIIGGTKCQSNECQGNLFLLLCITHMSARKRALLPVWRKLGITQK